MRERLVNVDRDTPMLLPADLREWVPAEDLVHFVISAVETMMLGLVIYCYANGQMSSRGIEGATYRDLAVRYLTGDTHPDHDSICAFRRENAEAVKQAFLELLHLARGGKEPPEDGAGPTAGASEPPPRLGTQSLDPGHGAADLRDDQTWPTI